MESCNASVASDLRTCFRGLRSCRRSRLYAYRLLPRRHQSDGGPGKSAGDHQRRCRCHRLQYRDLLFERLQKVKNANVHGANYYGIVNNGARVDIRDSYDFRYRRNSLQWKSARQSPYTSCSAAAPEEISLAIGVELSEGRYHRQRDWRHRSIS